MRLRALAKVKFVEDPIAGARYSRATSIVSSAYKRHGRILEFASGRAFARAIGIRSGMTTLSRFQQTTLPYGNSVRTLQVDMVAFDSADESIRAYEIKRGNGQFDAGKIRSITRDLKCIQVLLKSYGEVAKFKPTSAESKIIFYYGVRSIPRPWSLIKGELDGHFGFPVVERIEQANDYFRTKLHTLLEAA
jgi:hypothetical protein